MATVTPDIAARIILQGVHVDLTPAMQDVMREKLAPLFRHEERIVRINVRLNADQSLGSNRRFTSTAQIEIGGPDLVASAEGADAYAVIDDLVEKLERLLRRRSGRRKDKRNHPHDVELDAQLPKVESE